VCTLLYTCFVNYQPLLYALKCKPVINVNSMYFMCYVPLAVNYPVYMVPFSATICVIDTLLERRGGSWLLLALIGTLE